ncbi:MAG TPA: alkane 1-monooxygenase [Kiloniellales bacterium]|nr:alkane 1-monooxygenase [Kiloniellales bacterium]
MRWAPFYLLPFLLLFAAAPGLRHLGEFRHWQILVFVFLIVAPLDLLLGELRSELRRDEPAARWQRWLFRIVPWLWAPCVLGLLFWTLWILAYGKTPTPLQFAGLAVTTGFINGIVTVVFAHELMHRPSRGERLLAELYMTLVSYPHFVIEHVQNHHRNVATPADPATARLGESLYAFLPRLWAGELEGAWRQEHRRLTKRGRSPWSWRNRMLRYGLQVALLYLAVALWAGWLGVAMLAAQSLVAIFLLAIINYIEHYGLLRREIAPGTYEPVGPQHSWDSSHLLTTLFLLNLGRHADHHLRPGRPYQHLRHRDDAARLPLGYPAMLLLALVPPLFFRVMDHRVEGRRHAALAAGRAAA